MSEKKKKRQQAGRGCKLGRSGLLSGWVQQAFCVGAPHALSWQQAAVLG